MRMVTETTITSAQGHPATAGEYLSFFQNVPRDAHIRIRTETDVTVGGVIVGDSTTVRAEYDVPDTPPKPTYRAPVNR